MNINSINNIKKLIADSYTEIAINTCIDLFSVYRQSNQNPILDIISNEIIILSGRYKGYTHDEIIGILDREAVVIEKNRINISLLNLLDKIPNEIFHDESIQDTNYEYDILIIFNDLDYENIKSICDYLRGKNCRVLLYSENIYKNKSLLIKYSEFLYKSRKIICALSNDINYYKWLKKQIENVELSKISFYSEDNLSVPSEFSNSEILESPEDIIDLLLLKSKNIHSQKTYSETRIIDAAIPQNVIQNIETELIVLIRIPENQGLNELLINSYFKPIPNDVRTEKFDLEFNLNKSGNIQPIDLIVEIETNDFLINNPKKHIKIYAKRDTNYTIFLLTPIKTGELKLGLHIYYADVIIATNYIKTHSISKLTENIAGLKKLITIPLNVFSIKNLQSISKNNQYESQLIDKKRIEQLLLEKENELQKKQNEIDTLENKLNEQKININNSKYIINQLQIEISELNNIRKFENTSMQNNEKYHQLKELEHKILMREEELEKKKYELMKFSEKLHYLEAHIHKEINNKESYLFKNKQAYKKRIVVVIILIIFLLILLIMNIIIKSKVHNI